MNKKGITPIIAVVLLLMMTVAAAGAAFFWITTIQSRIQGQIGTQVSTTTTQTGAGLNIIALICNATSPATISLTLQNTGTSTILNGTSALTITDNQNRVIKVVPVDPTGNFNQNEIRTVSAPTGTGVLIQNSTYGVKITMPGGIEGTSDCVAQAQ